MSLMANRRIHSDKVNNQKDMNIQLINGKFPTKDALDMITQMIHVKIKYHENKIDTNSSEEDIKIREKRIKELQKDLFELRKKIESNERNIDIRSEITLGIS